CTTCHGDTAVGGGVLSDLRYSSLVGTEVWLSVVRDGALHKQGMVSYGDVLTDEEVTAIESYVITRARLAAQAPE
ncbi:MAG: PQQ-dependent dehydrogenase, methanol/ethanol family, partial [Gammaproteobacteria bacterium]|nr:PQQ-dependent dehydrogenase, methanol/ethanol family [Gammaproteobacteria bacterium]